MSAVEAEPHERIVWELARRVRDGDAAVLGSFTPIGGAAALLAQHTHAPNLDFIAYGAAGTDVGWLGLLGAEGRAHATGYGPLRNEELVGALRFRGLLAFEPVRPAQIDASGAMNLRWLGAGDEAVRLPGTAGAAEVLEMHRRPLGYLPRHERRSCVRAVDDPSLCAHPPHEQRDPFTLVTDLAVLELHPSGWRARSLHPGVTAEQARAATAFDVAGLETAPSSPPIEPHELWVLRERVDPLGVAALETVDGQERRRRLRALLEAEEARLAGGSGEPSSS